MGIEPARLLAQAAQMGVALNVEQGRQLAEYARLLVRWNAVHNLTAIRSANAIESHHLLDSLAIVPLVRAFAGKPNTRLLDVGSGAGLPGIPLAVACEALRVTLLDALKKRCAFLTQVRLELRLANVEVVHARVEQWRAAPFDLIVSRAFSSLFDFVRLTRHLLGAEGAWLAMKGPAVARDEISLPPGVAISDIVHVNVPGLNETRNLVVLRPK
jgi:16S rRNA (guanine527-N7)-methyltransferase